MVLNDKWIQSFKLAHFCDLQSQITYYQIFILSIFKI